MDNDTKPEVFGLTPEEQDKLERAQMVCDTLVTEMEMRMQTDKEHCMDSSTIIEIVDNDDLKLAEAIQNGMEMTKGYFRYHGYPTNFSYSGTERRAEKKSILHEYKLTVQLLSKGEEGSEITSAEE